MKTQRTLNLTVAFVWAMAAINVAARAPAQSQPDVTVWLQSRDGSDNVSMAVSETAVIQVWGSVANGRDNSPLVAMTAPLRGYNAALGKTLSFEVAGFNDVTIPNSQMQRSDRGPNIDDLLPHAHIDEYFFFADDPTSNDALDGLQNTGTDRSFLLDEIIIRGTSINFDSGPDEVSFKSGDQSPRGFYLQVIIAPPIHWVLLQLPSVAQGTGSAAEPFLINVTPEPLGQAFLLIGTAMLARRRRR